MKIMTLMISSLLATNAFAATIKSAEMDAEKKNILIDVTYSGGCSRHDFSLKLKGCLETYPVQCQADLIETTTDRCEGLMVQTVVISLEKYGLTDSYYKGGSLTIFGDEGWQMNGRSEVTVELP